MTEPKIEGRFSNRFGRGGAVMALFCFLMAHAVVAQQPEAAFQEAMRQGAQAMTAGNFGAAVAAYTTATQKMPGFAEGYFNLGLAQQQAGQLDQARASLEKSLQLKPGLRGANLFLGTIAYRQNRFKDAEAALLKETRIDPRSAKALMWLGVCRLAQDDPQGAIAPLDKAYALDAKDVDILYHRGRAYLLVANASYAAMFKIDRDSMRVHQVLGEADAEAYRTQDAINEFELAVKMAPRQPGLHEELGNQYWSAGQLDKASEAYREELGIDPHAVSAMYKLGSLLVLNRQAEKGIDLLRDALREDPTLADAHYYLASGLAETEREAEAIQEYELAIAADPADDRAMSAYYKLAQVYRKLHRTQEAQAALSNFQRLRAETKVRQEQKSAQTVRRRTELPVEDPERAALSAGQVDK
jgi:tetratricopeptide (TPR) repeat protein